VGFQDTARRCFAAFLKLVNMKLTVDESEDFVPAALDCDYVIVTKI
jgi:hypothetical protein